MSALKQNNALEKPYLQSLYEDKIQSQMAKEMGFSNLHAVPRLTKVVVNIGLGRRMQENSMKELAFKAAAAITGQEPSLTKARKSIAYFKIREGMPLGLKVTLRRKRMYEFLHRLVVIAMPRIRDFKGLKPSSFDGRGNFSFGIKEYHVFPEVKYDKITDILGLDICISTTARNNEEGKSLLKHFNFPFLS